MSFVFLVLIIIFNCICAQDRVRLLNCQDHAVFPIYPSEVLYVAPEWITGEKQNIEKYYWEYRVTYTPTPGMTRLSVLVDTEDPYPEDDGKILRIPKYTLLPNVYIVIVNATRNPGVTDVPIRPFRDRTKKCLFEVRGYYPVPIITGGSERYVPAQEDIVVNGSQSFDQNFSGRMSNFLNYNWTCVGTRGRFCKGSEVLSTKHHLVIPGNFVVDGDTIKVGLTLTLAYMEDDQISTTVWQTIRVRAQTYAVQIRCRRNCTPFTNWGNYEEMTVLEMVCYSNCEEIEDDDFTWTVIRENDKSYVFDFQNSRFGRTGPIFVIEKDTLTPDWYLITANVNRTSEKVGSTTIKISYHSPPTISNCRITPSAGVAFETLFKITCTQTPPNQHNLYELDAKNKNDLDMKNVVVNETYPKILERSFTLPPSDGKVFIVRVRRVEEESHPTTELTVTANVTSRLSKMSEEEISNYINETYYGGPNTKSVTEMVASKDPKEREKAMEIFENMIEELAVKENYNPELADFIADLKYQAALDMINAPVDNLDEVFRIGKSLTKLQQLNVSEETDPQLANLATGVCKRLAQKSLDIISNDPFPLRLVGRVTEVRDTMNRCFETSSKPNFKAVQGDKLNITTNAPTYEIPVATENYENYVDYDDKHFINLEYLKEVTDNMINGSSITAKVTAIATPAGEGPITTTGNRSSTIVLKDTGSVLVKTPIIVTQVQLFLSKDFENDTHSYDLLMTIWNTDIFWWNPSSVKSATAIVNVEFWHSSCKERVESFKNPAELYLLIRNRKNFTLKIERYSFIVPEGYASMSDDDLNYRIHVYRITLNEKPMLYVNFSNLESTDNFDVVITINKFPTTEDFANKVVVKSGSNETFQLLNQRRYPVLVYFGILVNKKIEAEKKTLKYEIGAFVTTCIRWTRAFNTWEPACKPGNHSNGTFIHCHCRHFSILAGYIQNITYLRQDLLDPDLELKLISFSIIFITVVSTLAIFLVLLLLSLLSRKREIYFLGDNNVYHRFAYLIMIKTGMAYNAGTSSSIIIRISGDKSNSDPHVLNYPDPQSRILQNFGRDLFILTTEHHLGNVKEIELWFDCRGTNPDWYCKEIKIYDLQKHVEWYFNVRRRISIISGTTHLVLQPRKPETSTVQAEPRQKTTKSFKNYFSFFKLSPKTISKFKWEPKYHMWYLCQKEENISYIKKLTVILSAVLTTYTLALILLGPPDLLLSDSLDKYHSYELGLYDIFAAFACSFPAFALHTAIAWCFRYSENQFSKHGPIQGNFNKLSYKYSRSCWYILFILITLSTTFLTMSGFWVPFLRSLIWLTVSGIGIACEIFIYESLLIYFLHFFNRFDIKYDIRRKAYEFHGIIEVQRKYLWTQFGERLLRPYFEHLYHPLRKRQIKRKTFVFKRRHLVITEFQDLIMFAIYIVILYVVILADKDSLVVQGKTTMEEMMEGKHTRTLDFHRVELTQQIYSFINKTLIPSIQPLRWYGNFVISEPGLMIDVANKYLGVVRLRQHRMMSYQCRLPKGLEFLNTTCIPEFSIVNEETGTFGYKWTQFSHYLHFDRMTIMWKYSTEDETKTFLTFGEFSTYSGGGYVAYLGRTFYNSYANFRQIVQKMWIDRATRVIFIEFLTYNADYNVFSNVRLFFEESATGLINTNVAVDTVRMLLVENEIAIISITFFFLFVIWVFLLMVKVSLGIIKHLRTFYKDKWVIIDLIIIILSVICIILFSVRMELIRKYLLALETAKRNDFQNYFHLFYIEDFETFAASFLVCVATVRLWKFVRFAKMFRVLEGTLAMAGMSIFTFAIAFMTVVLGSSMTLLLILGNQFHRLSTLMKTTRLLLTMSLKVSEMEVANFIHYKTAIFYMTLYMIVVELSKFVFIMIVVLAYIQGQLKYSKIGEKYTIKHYVEERIRYLTKFLKYKSKRLEAGVSQVKKKVEPKSDKFMYINSFSILSYKMRFMRYIMQCILRRNNRKASVLLQDDVKVTALICQHILVKDESGTVDVFYKGRVRGKRFKFVDEERIEKIANVVNLMLQDETVEFFAEKETDHELSECIKAIKKKMKSLKTWHLTLKVLLHKISVAEEQISHI